MASKRSSYVSYIRKAFLLRVHPDRFRSHSARIREGQAELVKAVTDRLGSSDFLSYINNNNNSRHNTQHQQQWTTTGYNDLNARNQFEYYVEKKNGSLVSRNICLNNSVEEILQNMSNSIIASGGRVPKPPPGKIEGNRRQESNGTEMENFLKQQPHFRFQNKKNKNKVLDRNLINFLTTSSKTKNLTKEIEKRKLDRLSANANALVARRLYKFQSVDGTKTNWSSESISKIFQSLCKLHEEHSSKFKVKSFYPFHVEFSSSSSIVSIKPHKYYVHNDDNDDDDENDEQIQEQEISSTTMCLYSGKISLNPASTTLQWLQILSSIDEEKIKIVKQNKKDLEQNIKLIHEHIFPHGYRLEKGHTCSAREYHLFAENLASFLNQFIAKNEGKHFSDQGNENHSSLTVTPPHPLKIIVESQDHNSFYRRKPRVTKQGKIQVRSSMHFTQIFPINNPSNNYLSIDESLKEEAISKLQKQTSINHSNMLLAQEIKHKYGLLDIFRATTSPKQSRGQKIDLDEFHNCLRRMYLYFDSEFKENDKKRLSLLYGKSIGIVGEGQFCHLRDDGSIIIPADWD